MTPRVGANIEGDGEPHIVLEVKPDANLDFSSGDAARTAYGGRYNIRTLGLGYGGEHYVAFWNEAYLFEPYPSPKD